MLQVGIAFNEKLIRTLIFNALGVSQRDQQRKNIGDTMVSLANFQSLFT